MLVENHNFFIPHMYSTSLIRGTPSEFPRNLS